ncbi:MAG: nucleoside-diphosphate kinase [Thermoplasmatota archaeon]
MERTFAMVKPDGVARGLVGEVVRRYEARGLKLAGLKLMRVTRRLAEEHYAEHKGKKFYDGLIAYITSGPVAVICLEGKDAVKVVRSVNGATNPIDAAPGTLRGDLALDIGRNVVHGSDSAESAARELAIYFNKDDLLEYPRADATWLTE